VNNGLVTRQPQWNDRLRAGIHTMALLYFYGQVIRAHANPGWTIVISPAGHITWEAEQRPTLPAAGVVFPPHVTHRFKSVAGHVSVFIDPWHLQLGPGHRRAIPLDLPTADQVRVLWPLGDAGDPDERARETVALLRRRDLLPCRVAIDPRVAAALPNLEFADCLDQVAAAVRLSSSRLRALVHEQTGAPPAQWRMWQRLRAAILDLPAKPIALAAVDAGFADQAHLTRTATRLVGQTPGDLARNFNATPHRRQDEGTFALTAAA
jgi:AraC-like DNA-binding protein